MAYIRKRNNKFQVIIKKQEYPRLSKTFLEKKTAQLWATEIELQMEKKTFEDYSPAQSICLKELLIKYRDEITSQKKGFAPETCKINLLIRHKISLNSLMQLKSHHIYSLIKELHITRKRNTVISYVNIMRNCWNVAKRVWGIALPAQSPFDLVSIKRENDTRDRILSKEEYKKLLDACNTSNLPCLTDIVEFAYHSGARQGEILRMKKEDIDWNKETITFKDTKNGEDRKIPLSIILRKIIIKYPFGFGVIPRRLRKHFEIACKKAEIKDLRFHDLRACFCTNALLSGMSVAEVATLSGHRDWSQLKRYTRIKPEDLKVKLNNVVNLGR